MLGAGPPSPYRRSTRSRSRRLTRPCSATETDLLPQMIRDNACILPNRWMSRKIHQVQIMFRSAIKTGREYYGTRSIAWLSLFKQTAMRCVHKSSLRAHRQCNFGGLIRFIQPHVKKIHPPDLFEFQNLERRDRRAAHHAPRCTILDRVNSELPLWQAIPWVLAYDAAAPPEFSRSLTS